MGRPAHARTKPAKAWQEPRENIGRVDVKTCNKCGIQREVEQFHKSNRSWNKDGHSKICLFCDSERRRVKRDLKRGGPPTYGRGSTSRVGRVRSGRRSFEERFWEKVEKGDSCWIWVGALLRDYRGQSKPYGQIMHSCTKSEGMVRLSAHRASWIIHNGPIPDGMKVLHKCDNPPCVNPEHLFLGTQKDNYEDCKAKGRLGARWQPYRKAEARI